MKKKSKVFIFILFITMLTNCKQVLEMPEISVNKDIKIKRYKIKPNSYVEIITYKGEEYMWYDNTMVKINNCN